MIYRDLKFALAILLVVSSCSKDDLLHRNLNGEWYLLKEYRNGILTKLPENATILYVNDTTFKKIYYTDDIYLGKNVGVCLQECKYKLTTDSLFLRGYGKGIKYERKMDTLILMQKILLPDCNMPVLVCSYYTLERE